MYGSKFLTGIRLIAFMAVTLTDPQLSHLQIVRVSLQRSPFQQDGSIQSLNLLELESTTEVPPNTIKQRHSLVRRESYQHNNEEEMSFQREEVGWSNINEEVDMVIPMLLHHLEKLGIEHLQLPDMKESISVNPLFITYEAGLFLTNGIVYNVAGIERYGDAFMTYEGKSFLCRFNLIIKSLQFEYRFLLKLMALEGYGNIIGSLDDTIIFAELAINVFNTSLQLHDFRIVKFSNIHVQLDQRRIIRQLTGVILSPITNLFRDRITTSISDGLKDQMQIVMDDFNNEDPLELRSFTKQLLAGLTGQSN